jgi:hypothetical protein
MRRRNQHALVHEIGKLTTEICIQMADNDEQMAAFKSKSSSSKGPRKYDQMTSDSYFHVLASIVVKSEHKGRIEAEAHVAELEGQLASMRYRLRAYERRPESSTPTRTIHDAHYQSSCSSLTKRMRTLEIDQEGKKWVAAGARLPPSPEASPRVLYEQCVRSQV